jgi:hypothetical protein
MKSNKTVTRFESKSFRDSKRTPHAKTRTQARKQQRVRKADIRSGKGR